MKNKSLFLFLLLAVLFLPQNNSFAQPIAPTKELKGQSENKNLEDLDLPYKVDENITDENSGENNLQVDALWDQPEQEKVEWDKIPYYELKGPDFKPKSDPDLFEKKN